MASTKVNMPVIVAGAVTLMLLSAAALLQPAFAHGHFNFPVNEEPVQGKQAVMVIGHVNEPAFGVEPGVYNGLHGLELSLTDFDTKMPLADAQLKADKYYFKDLQSFNAASSVNDADEVVKGVTVGGVFGNPGFYQVRQLLTDGIYGYRIYGTVNYFNVASVPIDVTAFCVTPEGNTTKFSSSGFIGGYGCATDIKTIAFPKNALDNKTGGENSDKAVLKVVAVGPDGKELGMFTKLRQSNKLITQGFTPFYFQGKVGETYKVSMANFENKTFGRWDDGSTNKDRTVTLSGDTTLTAYYNVGSASVQGNSTTTASTLMQDRARMTIPVAYTYATSEKSIPAVVSGTQETPQSTSTDVNSLLQFLVGGLPIAVASVIGTRKYKQKQNKG